MKTGELTRAGVLSALIVLFILAFIYVPVVSYFGMFLGACAVAVLVVSVSSPKAIVLSLGVSMVLTALFSDVMTMLYSGALMVMLPGIALGICFRKKASFATLLLCGGLAYLVAMVLGFILMKVLYHTDMIAELKTMSEEFFRGMIKVMESMPELANQAEAEAFEQALPSLLDMVTMVLPGVFLIAAGMLSLGSVLLSRGVLRRMGTDVSYLPSFSCLTVSKQISYGYLLLMVASLFVKNTSLYFMLYNVALVLSLILFVCGVSLLKYWINKTGVPKGVCLLLLCMVLPFLMLLFQFVVLLGAADTLWDFRRLRGKKAM